MLLESNMDVIRNNQDLTLTITATYLGGKATNIIAYQNNGKQINLSLSEEIRAEEILLASRK